MVVLVVVVIAGPVMEVMVGPEVLILAVVLVAMVTHQAAVWAPLVALAQVIQVVASVHPTQAGLEVLVVLILVNQVGLANLDQVVRVGLENLGRIVPVGLENLEQPVQVGSGTLMAQGDQVDLVKAITIGAVVASAVLQVALEMTEMLILNLVTDPSECTSSW